ncbi:hypothetical protein ACF0H5_019654 [Mactra antiquata]
MTNTIHSESLQESSKRLFNHFEFSNHPNNDTNMDEERTDIVKCRDLVNDFAEHTTLHGLRHIVLSDSYLIIRIFWLLLTILCTSLLVLQVIDRVQYFQASPVAVNFKINYNQSLQFPAITICNQNAFRATAASDEGLYELIEKMYRDGIETSEDSGEYVTDNIHVHMDELYTKLSHKREDFIVSCSWAGEVCTAKNFTVTLTDHGMCYTFNGYNVESPNITVTASGAKHGLRLTVNTEQYEAMPGPHDASGIKLLATSQPEFPRVEEVGMAIPTGSHAFVGLGVLVIKNLPQPHGECGERKLYTSEKYSQESCTLECVTEYVVNVCGCRNFFMPDLTGNTPVCTVYQYFNCYEEAYDYINKRVVMECDCPTSCKYLLYESTISYASTSANVKGHLLDYSKGGDLQKKFFHAREVSSRMNRATYSHFKTLVTTTVEDFDQLKRLITVDIMQRIDTQLQRVEEWRENLTSVVAKKQFIYEYQKYSLQKNFMRARDAMEERTLSVLCLGFHEHVFNTELLLRQMKEALDKNDSDAVVLYKLLKNMLRSRMETAGRAFNNYTQLYNAYFNGQKIFNYKFQTTSRKHNPFIVPKALVNESLFHNAYAVRYSARVGTDINRVMNASAMFGEFVDDIYTNVTQTINILQMNKLSEEFIDSCEDYFHSKSTFYFESIDRPLRIIEERIFHFSALINDFNKVADEIANALLSLKDTLLELRSGFIHNSEIYMNMAQEYFNENSTNNVTKMEIAELFTSKSTSDKLHILSLFFADVRQKGQFVFEQWSNIQSLTLKIWDVILHDIDSLEYYNYTNNVEFLRNYSDVYNETSAKMLVIQENNDLRDIINKRDLVFAEAMNSLRDELDKFIAESQMKETFLRENFLQLDIFFKELRHEEIEQQKAYDLIALLCDVGGSLGLFIGASVMTIFEIIDFLLSNTARGVINSAKKSKY